MQKKDIKILIVDDMPMIRGFLLGVLKKIGYINVVSSDNGMDAYTKLKLDTFDLVISDWNMPILDGLGLLRKIRGNEKLNNLLFLMMTAESDKEKVTEAIKEGINGYIVKPVNAQILEKKLHALLKNKING